jgi:hypothetical protein
MTIDSTPSPITIAPGQTDSTAGAALEPPATAGQVQPAPDGIGFVGEVFQGVGPFKSRWYRKLPDGRKVRLVRVPGPPTQAEVAALERVKIDVPHDIVELESGALKLRKWQSQTERGVTLFTIGRVDYYRDNARVRGVLRPVIVPSGPPKSNAGDTVSGAQRVATHEA